MCCISKYDYISMISLKKWMSCVRLILCYLALPIMAPAHALHRQQLNKSQGTAAIYDHLGRLTLKSQPFVALAGIPCDISFDILASGTKDSRLNVLAINDFDGLLSDEKFRSEKQMILGQEDILSDDNLYQTEGKVTVVLDGTGIHKLRILLLDGPNGTILSEQRLNDLHAIPGFLCMIPSLVIIVVAVASQNVLLALFAGLYVGGTLISAYNPFTGLLRAGDTFMVEALQEADMGMLLFTWFMSGLVGIISRSGGALGIGRAFARHATTPSRAQVPPRRPRGGGCKRVPQSSSPPPTHPPLPPQRQCTCPSPDTAAAAAAAGGRAAAGGGGRRWRGGRGWPSSSTTTRPSSSSARRCGRWRTRAA